MKLSKLLAVAVAAGAATVTLAAPANAADNPPPRPMTAMTAPNCTPVKHGDVAGVTKTGSPTVSLQVDGVEIATPAQADKAVWKGALAAPAALRNVRDLSYWTYKFNTGKAEYAAPAFHVYLSLPGGKSATLVYEPYWQGQSGLLKPSTTDWQKWYPLEGKWWTASHDVAGMTAEGGGGEHNAAWDAIVSANPEAAMTGYGWGLGSYNDGAKALVQDLLVRTTAGCTLDKWSTSYPAPTVAPTTAPTVAPVVLPTAHTSSTPAASLPVTGTNVGVIAGGAVVLVALGIGGVVIGRRRRFTA